MNTTVADLMTPDVVVTYPQKTLGEVRCEMLERHIHAIVVLGPDEQPAGIVTSTDFLEHLVCDEMRVAKCPTRKVLTISHEESPANAAKKMKDNDLHHLVVTKDDKIVGILSAFDLLEVVS